MAGPPGPERAHEGCSLVMRCRVSCGAHEHDGVRRGAPDASFSAGAGMPPERAEEQERGNVMRVGVHR
jgi:hypothetical protein